MTKKQAIKKIIQELQAENESLLFDYYGERVIEYLGDKDVIEKFEKEYGKIDVLEDLGTHFDKLDNIGTYQSISNNRNDTDIFSVLSKLKNLSCLLFETEDLSKTEKYIEVGLKKFPKLDTLELWGTKLKKFPKSILGIPTLKYLGLLGNYFYVQNFHFRLIAEVENLYTEISKLAIEKKLESINVYAWGLTIDNHTVVILRDYSLCDRCDINSISVYILEEKDRYLTFKTYYNLFTELDKQFNCFQKKKIKGIDVLDLFFFHKNYIGFDAFIADNEIIDYEILKQYQKIGNKQYESYFVDELLEYLGGEKLIEEIEQERKQEETTKTEEFYKDKNKWITSANIQNFKLFNELEIKELSQINIIVGKNGVGKTSLLQSIASCFIPKNSDEIKLRKRYINQKKDKTSKLQFAEILLKWSEKFERKQRIYIDEVLSDKELPHTYLALAYGENLFTDKEKSISEHLKYLESGDYKTCNVETLFNNYTLNLPNPLEILDKLQAGELRQSISKEKQAELLVIGRLLFDTLNEYLNTKPTDIFEIKLIDYNHKFVDKKGNNLDLEQISEGYRTNIVLITDILVKILSARNKLFLKPFGIHSYNQIFKEVCGTILIDEFDKHLHPVWQKSFVGTLKRMLPNIQFILTTHNIVALQSAEGEKAFKLNMDDNGNILIEEKKIKKGCSIKTLFNEFFDWNSEFYGPETQPKLKRFKELATVIYDENPEEISLEFINLARELTSDESDGFSEEIKAVIATEIAQIEYITGKQIEL